MGINAQTSDWVYPVSWELAAKLRLMSSHIWAAIERPSKIFLIWLQHKDGKCSRQCLEARDITGLGSLAIYRLLCSRTIPVANNPASTTFGPQLSPQHLSSFNLIKRCSLICTCTHTSSHMHHRCRKPPWPFEVKPQDQQEVMLVEYKNTGIKLICWNCRGFKIYWWVQKLT